MTQTPHDQDSVARISDSLDAASRAADRLAAATNRFTVAIVLIALAALGFEAYRYFNPPVADLPPLTNHRMPVANPPLEPDRPDLIE